MERAYIFKFLLLTILNTTFPSIYALNANDNEGNEWMEVLKVIN